MAVPIITAAMITGIGRLVVAGLGVGVVTFVGLEAVLSQLSGLMSAQMGSLAGAAAGVVGLMGLQQAVSMILSAYSVKIALTALKKFRVL